MFQSIGSDLQRGFLLKEQGRFAEAENYFRAALLSEPRNTLALHAMASCQFQQEKTIVALETIRSAIAIEPDESDHRALLAFILCALRKNDEAEIEAMDAVSLDPRSAYAFCSLAHVQMSKENWGPAESAARNALEIDPENLFAANALAHALRLQNRMTENAIHVESMLARDPDNARTHATAGWAALQNGETPKAEQHFREALRLDPNLETARMGLLHSFKARSFLYRGYLQYCFWMQRMSRASRWAVIIGLMLFVQFVKPLFKGPAEPVGWTIAVAYFLFVLWVHVAQGVGNFILLTDRFARLALKAREKLEACFVGGPVIFGVLFLAAGSAISSVALTIAGITMIGISFPFAYTFTNASREGTALFGSMGVIGILAGLMNLAALVPGIVDPVLVSLVTTFAMFGIVGTTWLANLRYLNRPI